jgi:co-chaperonin GroES (HSP10)
MPAMVMEHEVDPKADLLKKLGNIDDVDVFNNQVLVATYKRPEKTKSGLYLTDGNRDEDRFQSKVGVIVKLGPIAFDDPAGNWFKNADLKVGDWVVYRISEGWSLQINKVDCRLLDDTSIRARIQHPDTVW